MPDHELRLIVLVHVLNSYVQKKSAFSAHSKLPLTTVLADFASTLANYEKAFGYSPDTTRMDASSLSQIINSSPLKNNFIIKSENGGELLLSGPLKQGQSALVSVVVDSSIKYGKTLVGQLQGLKDEYHSFFSGSEASKISSKSASKVSENDHIAESDDHETSVPTTSTDATKTETSSQSAPGENESMEIDEQNAEQDPAAIHGTPEVENPACSVDDEKKEEVEENDDEGLVEEEENPKNEEIESESTENQNSEDLVSESVTQEETDSQSQDEENEAEMEENAETNEEPEIAQEEDRDIDSSRESDDSVSDEIERSSRLLLEESERDNAEVEIFEKPKLADVEGDTKEEKSDKTGETEEMEDENQENVPVAESNLKDETNNTLHKPVASEPDEAERENENVEEGMEETLEEDDQKAAEKHNTPQEKSKLNTASSRKRKAEEASVEDAESDSPKKPRRAKDTSSTTRRKSSAVETKLTPAQKYKRFQNIAINLIKSIEAHRFSSPFLTAVTAPEYSQVVKHPRDLKSIMKNVRKRHDSAVYTSVKELERDIMLMFANCVMFNKSSTPLVKIAQEMKNDVRNTFKMFEETESSIF